MLLSLNLIRKFVDIDASPQEIADKITLSLTEVEKIEKKGNDTVIEIENKALTHRPDCFSHLGMAREIGAFFNKKVHDPLHDLVDKGVKQKVASQFELHVEPKNVDKNLCQRYCVVVLTDITIGPSPKWMSETLENLGIRPINNVVDITNYVMIELGQPLHAFDYDKVEDHAIKVRTATAGETMITLDGKKRELTREMLVIADSKKPIGLAGIMGGKNTEVTDKTTTIILEAATFEPMNNRKTSKALRLRSEASTRFEKNLDPALPRPALIRAIDLLIEYGDAKIVSDIVDVQHINQTAPSPVLVPFNWISSFLGKAFTPSDIQEILNRIGITSRRKENNLELTIPSWRNDLKMPADIAEEVARISGYDEIPVTLPAHDGSLPPKNKDIQGRSRIKHILQGMGFFEVITSPFIGDELLKKTDLAGHDHLELQNPLTVDQKYMRRSLFPSLLTVLTNNMERTKREDIRIYELNKLFVPVKDKKEPLEPYYLTGIMLWNMEHGTGNTEQGTGNKQNASNLYRTSKGVVESLFDQLNISGYSFKPYSRDCDMYNPFFHPNMTAQIYIADWPMGIFGALHPHMQTVFALPENIFLFDLHVGTLIDHAKKTPSFQPIPSHPPVIEDKTIQMGKGVLAGDVIKKITSTSPLITSVELVDMFENNYTFRITFQHPQRNLTDKEGAEIVTQILT